MLNDLKELENGEFEGYDEEHNWTHKSCLWNQSYANTLLLPHNIDLMHQKRNGVESVISMCFYVTGFTKDNLNTKKDLTSLCDSPLLEARANPGEI
jgi:hypothetical protein